MCAYIILKEGSVNTPMKTSEVSYFKANGNFVMVYFVKGGFNKQSNCLKEWENDEYVASSLDFVRVHDSYMLNWRNVKSFESTYATMDDADKTRIPFNAEGHKKLKAKYSGSSSTSSFQLIPLFLPRQKDARNDEEE